MVSKKSMEKICEEIWKTWVRKKSMGKTFKKRRWVKKIKKTSDQNSHIGLLVVLLKPFQFFVKSLPFFNNCNQVIGILASLHKIQRSFPRNILQCCAGPAPAKLIRSGR